MASVVDQIARDGVAKATAMIEAHERVCAERAHESETWRNLIIGKLDTYFNTVNVRLTDLTGQVEKIYSNLWAAAAVIVATLLGAIAFLISNHGL